MDHKEGGKYQYGIYESDFKVNLTGFKDLERVGTSTCYYMLNSKEPGIFHKLVGDECWMFHDGTPLTMYLMNATNGFIETKLLGLCDKCEPIICVKGGTIFGEIGGDKTHLTNAMKQQKELKALNKEIRKENELLKEANKSENEFIDKVDKETAKDILNPVKKGIIKQYKDEDIDNLSTYSKELAEDNIRKDLEIKSLTEEVNSFRSGKAYKEQNKIIANQKIIINQKDDEINTWKNKFEELADEFKNFKKKIQDKIYSLASKVFEILHIPYSWHEANDIDYAIDTARDYLNRHSKSKDDLER